MEETNYVSAEALEAMEAEQPKAKAPRKAKCKRLSLGAPKELIRYAHKQKMKIKAARRANQRATGLGLPIRPNRSRKWDNLEVAVVSN